ncbi:hypothetical protein [Bombella favorum]|uniref:DUF2125 domain-containing protein n=1 Tax=Bombella favorum TaxID=2039164 RepID=A0ABR5ZPT1_9PROT|nr:hypothetical protein [Bombella favorum]MBA5726336.1 hypothetical protein [Bombella favorum]
MILSYRRTILTITSLCLLLLAGSWGLYLQTQALLSRQMEHLAVQSLPSDGPTPTLTIQSSEAKGWPFGAWRRLHGVSFHTHLNGTDLAGATPTLQLGGNWLDWAQALMTGTELPLHLPERTALRMVQGPDNWTLILDNARLHISKTSIPCPPTATGHGNSNMPLYRAHFRISDLHFASSRLPYSLTLLHSVGTIRFAPQSLSHADPALQNRALLSASLTARQLNYPAPLLHNFRIEQVHSLFALLPSTASPHVAAGLSATKASTASPWPDIPLRLRLHELSAIIQPATGNRQKGPPPRLSLGGELYVPAFSGTLSVSLTNWQWPLEEFLQSTWFRQNIPPAMQVMLNNTMNSPRMMDLSTHPLMLSLPLDHGVPPGLSSERLHTLYDHFSRFTPRLR